MPQDPGAAGKADAETKVKLLKGYSVVVKPISGDKATRARPASAQVGSGQRQAAARAVERAVPQRGVRFPNSTFDDQVDAFADALNELALGSSYNWDNV
jgi:predicted phage terminase large subunit-like protein